MTPLDRLDLRHWRQALLATTCLVVAGLAVAPEASSAPSGLSVGAGQISVSNPNASTTLIRQGTNNAILNWNSFSIAHGESVVFQQPGSSSVALNRVTGGQASSILGNLTANGHVWLVNPNGILFGAGAVVNVAGLMATTSDIRDSDFLAGNYNFGIASPNPNAGVVNQGTIQAAGGEVVLSGAYVRNDGLIQANLGTVVLGGAKTFTVDFAGDKLLSYAVTTPVDQTPMDANGNPVTALVTNTGSAAADGGQVFLTARAANNILDNVINTTGIIEANTASMVNGTVVLDAGSGGATVGGQISATGLNPGETGGTVKVLGNAVTIASTATINASGDAGGGVIDIGGDFHGAGPDPNAWTTNVQQGAIIQADAVTTGNGGNVAVWADGYTAFNGAIGARGGALGGNGGFVETSGHQGLSVQTGTVNTLAPNGHAGDWLLDPTTITVAGSGSAVLADVNPFGSTSGGANPTIAASTITGAGSNVTLQATQDITFSSGSAVNITTGINLTAQAGNNINVNANITTTGSNIKLSANDNGGGTATGSGGITIGSGVSLNTAMTGATGGTINLVVNGGTGAITDLNANGASLKTSGGSAKLTTTGTGDISLSGGINTIGTASVTSGAVVIGAGGNVTIGSGLSLATQYSGNQESSTTVSIVARGFDTSTTSQTPGNGGSVSIQGASINLPFGIVTRGGDSTNPNTGGSGQLAWTGSGAALTANGGNAGAINLDATSGAVTIGSPGTSTGDLVGLIARGGNSTQGTGGNGAAISVTGNTVSLARAQSNGGDTIGGTSGGNGAAIAIAGTASSGAAITLYGESDSPTTTTTTPLISLTSHGGFSGLNTFGQLSPGTVTGSAGNIQIGGSTSGGTLNGSAYVQLATGAGPNGGSTVSLSAGGGLSAGGSIAINGPINATTANVESLRLSNGNGSATVNGNIGASTALNSLALGGGLNDLPANSTGGSDTFQGMIVTAQLRDLRSSGSLAMNGGGVFSGDIHTDNSSPSNPISLGGNFRFLSSFTGNLSGGQSPYFTLSANGSFDTSALNVPVSVSGITGNSFSFGLNVGNSSFTAASISNTRLSLGGSGTYTFNNATGLSFSHYSGTVFVNGTKVFPFPAANLAPFIPRVVPPVFSAPIMIVAPQPIQVPISFVPLTPIVISAPGPTTGMIATPSDNAPTTVQGTDTGGSMFTQISSSSPTPTGGSSSTGSSSTGSGGTDNGTGSDSSTTSSGTSAASNAPTGSTSGTATPAGPRASAAPGTPATPGSSASASAGPPPDSGDRALSVIASPPPVQPVAHALPTPPRVTTTVVPGFVSQVQKPAVPKSGTPGIQENYSASGNAGRW